jgi:hypothetical protein
MVRSRRSRSLLLAVAVALCVAHPAAADVPPEVIEWGAGLSEKAIQYRDDHNISPRRNVAVFEFEYPNGRRGTIAIDSQPFSKGGEPAGRPQGHSERRAARILRSYGIKPSQVTAIYSELEPCSNPGAYCKNLIGREFPRARVFYSYQYGATPESRRAGTRALRAAVGAHNQVRGVANTVLRAPGSRPVGGAMPDMLSRPVRGLPGGIDFSSLELRYVADSGSARRRGLRYAFRGVPAAAPSDPAVGLVNARQTSDAFFVWLALPPQSFWVNLKPNEPDRIIDPQFARSDAGRVLLEADLLLKKTVGFFLHPDSPTGAPYWQELDNLYGNRPDATYCFSFRQWIVPAPATVRETAHELYILDAPLDVKMESEYLGPNGTVAGTCPLEAPALEARKQEIFRRLILPHVVQAVNTSPLFAALRRVYLSRVAAEWVRTRGIRRTPLGRIANSGRIDRWVARPAWDPMGVFNQYLQSVRDGEFRVEHQLPSGNTVYTRTYVYGGVDFSRAPRQNVTRRDFIARWPRLARDVRRALRRPARDVQRGDIWLGGRSRAG